MVDGTLTKDSLGLRIKKLLNLNEIEVEIYFLLSCSLYYEIRHNYTISTIFNIPASELVEESYENVSIFL